MVDCNNNISDSEDRCTMRMERKKLNRYHANCISFEAREVKVRLHHLKCYDFFDTFYDVSKLLSAYLILFSF